MVHEYAHILISDIDTFLFYLEQLKTYYCGYLVRYYGLAIKYGELKHESTHKVKLVQNSQKSIEDEPNKVSSKGRKKNSKL